MKHVWYEFARWLFTCFVGLVHLQLMWKQGGGEMFTKNRRVHIDANDMKCITPYSMRLAIVSNVWKSFCFLSEREQCPFKLLKMCFSKRNSRVVGTWIWQCIVHSLTHIFNKQGFGDCMCRHLVGVLMGGLFPLDTDKTPPAHFWQGGYGYNTQTFHKSRYQ